jgi:hypothetical protein
MRRFDLLGVILAKIMIVGTSDITVRVWKVGEVE